MRILRTAALTVLWPCTIWAQQPFYTDDADVTAAGKIHIEVFDEYDWLQHSLAPRLKQNTVNVRLNYGLGRGLELDLDSPLITIMNDTASSLPRAFGIGDTNLGFKYNFRAENGKAPALSVATYIETPTGDSKTGLGSGLTDIWTYGIIQKTVLPALVLRFNAGYLFTGNTSTGVVGITSAHGHVATMGASMVRTLTERIRVGADITAAATRNAALQRSQLQILVGGNYEIRDGLTLDIGAIKGHFAASPRVGLQIGFSLDYR